MVAILVSIIPRLSLGYINRPDKVTIDCFPIKVFKLLGLLNDKTTHCGYMLVKMNKENYNLKKIKDCLFLERNPNASAISCTNIAVLTFMYLAGISNICVVHSECITPASFRRPQPHYTQHSILVIVNPRMYKQRYIAFISFLKALRFLSQCCHCRIFYIVWFAHVR